MIRTQIYLPEDLKNELTLLAKREKKPVAKIIRQALKSELKRKRGRNAGYTLGRIASMAIKGGPKDLSTKLSDYLYGEKSDYSRKATREKSKWYRKHDKSQPTKRNKDSK